MGGETKSGSFGVVAQSERQKERVPSEYRNVYEEALRWLEEMSERWRPEKPRKVILSGQCLSVEAFPHHPEADALYVDMLCEAGVDAVDLYLWPGLWERNRERYDRLLRHIRKRGKKLILGYQVLPQQYRAGQVLFRFEPHFKKPPTFEEFLTLERRLTAVYIERYRPYLYWVVVEPATNEMRLGVNFSPQQWRRLTVEICRLVKRLSPKTLTGVATVQVKQIEAFADVPELDVLGHDLYGKNLGEFEKLVALAKKQGKRVWLAETWASHGHSPGFDQPWRAEIDAKWVEAMFNLAQSKGLEGMNVWFTTHFVAYLSACDQADFERRLLAALKEGRRTVVFNAFRSLPLSRQNASDEPRR